MSPNRLGLAPEEEVGIELVCLERLGEIASDSKAGNWVRGIVWDLRRCLVTGSNDEDVIGICCH